MKLIDHFRSFLKETVNLNDTRLSELDTHVSALVGTVKDDDVLGPKFEDHIPQGSWAHATIIKPPKDQEFDADFLLQLTEDDEWSAEPKRYLQEVRAALRRSTTYKEKVQRKDRCVRIVYANDCHVDIVPYIVRDEDHRYVVSYSANAFEQTDPEGFTDWMKERDQLTGGEFRRVLRLLKWLRDRKQTFDCKSVILTTLVGGRVTAIQQALDGYKDTPTALKTMITDLDAWLQANPWLPVIEDPSGSGATFNHRWDQQRYSTFRDKVHDYAAWVVEAYDEPDRDKSIEAWRRLFGDDFAASVSKASSASALVPAPLSAATPGGPLAPDEEKITDRFRYSITHSANITARWEGPGTSKVGGKLTRSSRRLPKNHELYFKVQTNAPPPYEVWWKVRNFGSEAAAANGLRGEIKKAERPRAEHFEKTLYTGDHRIEAYIVRDDVVLATAVRLVRIA